MLQAGPLNLITDVPGLKVGNATDSKIKTGTTVLAFDRPATTGYHIMGGAPGTRDTELLVADKLVSQVDGLVLSGGSAFGLDAAGGVMDAFAAQGRGFSVGPARVPIVPAAIIFDLLSDGDKDWGEDNPYRDLGKQAARNLAHEFKLGAFGAGTGASCANSDGGLGSASIIMPSGTKLGALVAVNPLGSVKSEAGRYWAGDLEFGSEFGGLGRAQLDGHAMPATKHDSVAGQNTTIAIIATDAPLSQAQATRLATAAHDGMTRAIWPSHTPFDGDLVFAASTASEPGDMDPIELMHLGHAASVCLARAIARGVYEATRLP